MSIRDDEIIVGIDLGTTNSEIGFVSGGSPRLVEVDGDVLFPSVVGVGDGGEFLVGRPALNQYLVYPERTVRSIKRRMGSDETIALGERKLSPVEVSAVILERLKVAAEKELGRPVQRAVITVPAYFTDAQRTATKEAGEVAGWQVERILNEPTAAALLYVSDKKKEQTFLVYDLGGGTFDVSVVKKIGARLEILASTGDNHLGGDDFDQALVEWSADLFSDEHGVDPLQDVRARCRLVQGAERTKIKLSTDSYVRFIEENLVIKEGKPLHLDAEISRRHYEEMIYRFIERTKEAVHAALKEAGVLVGDLDEVILVGGSTRTPLVSEILKESTGLEPRRDIDPDTAVAKGAALQAARISGMDLSSVLIDITPFSFGISHLGYLHGKSSLFCYKSIIRKNTPLPTRQTEVFYTVSEGQTRVEVNVFQGEDPDARNNLKIGRFFVEGLDRTAPYHSSILFDLTLDLDGILNVEVTEKHTGLKKRVTIEDSFRKLSEEDISKKRESLFAEGIGWHEDVSGDAERDAWSETTDEENAGTEKFSADQKPAVDSLGPARPKDLSVEQARLWVQASALLEKARNMESELPDDDRKEVDALSGELVEALKAVEFGRVGSLSTELSDVLFYLEG